MRRILILLILIFSISVIIFLFKFNQGSSKKTSYRDFAIENIEEITSIYIHQKELPVIKLSRDGNSWNVNDRYLVRKNAIDNLLEVIQGLSIQFIPSKNATQNIFRDLNVVGVNIQIYSKGNKKIKDYFIGGVTPDERGTYMLMAGSQQAFVMHVPTLEGSFRGRFTLSEIDWRDRTILNEDIKNIDKIEVNYPRFQNESFALIRDGSQFKLIPFGQLKAKDPKFSNQNLIHAYVEGYESLVAEYIENENPYRDSIIQKIPFSIITLQSSSGERKTLKIIAIDNDGNINTQKLDDIMINRYFVDCSWGDFMLVQHRLIKKLLRGYSYFFDDGQN